jgi:hypothetical protein
MAEQQIPIGINDETIGGKYSNLAIIAHTENEFVLDFALIHPPKGVVNSRVITSPAHAKRLLKALQQNIEIYERNFGAIKEAPEPPKFGIDFSKN